MGEESIILNRKKKLQLEESLMVREVVTTGSLVGCNNKITIINSKAGHSYSLKDNKNNHSSNSTSNSVISDEEFTEILMRRILIMEQKDREKG